MTVDELLRENDKRLASITAPYDPVTGNSRDPNRIPFRLSEGTRVWIPKEMKKDRLSPEEFERERCRNDFPYWAARYAYIKRKGGGEDTLFILNRPQRKLVNCLERMRRAGKPIRLILLKARQWGGSTCVQLYMAWLQLVHEKGLNSLIIAHQGAATDEIKDMFDRMLDNYPVKMLHDPGEECDKKEKKTERAGRSGAAIRVVARNCKVKVGSAESPDSCRGGDYNLVHCSEVGLWRATRLKTPEQLLRAATSGVLLRPGTMIVYESTANGTGNFFHREYEAARRGRSQFTPLFVALYEIEQYSLEFEEGEIEEFAANLLEGRENPHPLNERCQSGRYLWWLWERGATLQAIHWYVNERAKYSDHALMAAEYPSDDVEAFVHSGARVFDKYKIEELRAGCRPPLERGEVVGDSIHGEESLKQLRFAASREGALAVWRFPENNTDFRITNRYVTVVDIGGRALSSDWSVITVIDREGMMHGGKPEIAAQWRGHSDFDLLAWNAARIAAYYDNALLVVESNTLETHDNERIVEGDQSGFLLNRLRDAYPNLYARKGSEDDIRRGMPVRYGFHTNTRTKPMIISGLVQAVREGLYIERDEEALAEMAAYEQRQNGSYGALQGHHDDILMTRAIGLHVCFNEMDPPRIVHAGGVGRIAISDRDYISEAMF